MIETVILKNGNTKEARKILNNAVQNTNHDFSELKIRLLIYEKKLGEALLAAEKSQSNDFTFRGDRHLYIAMINRYLNNKNASLAYFDSALVSYKEILNEDPDNTLIISLTGLACAGKGIKEQAMDYADKTRELRNEYIRDEGQELVNLALIYTMTGEYGKAISTIEYLLKTPSLFSVKILGLDPAWKPLLDKPALNRLIKKYQSDSV